MPDKSTPGSSHTAVYALLGLGSAMCIALVAGRTLYSHTNHFQFLVWNLFLAWIPLVLAALIYRIAVRRGDPARLIVVPVALVWLLFFPNAPYIVTDFVHLGQFHDNVPGWFDVMLIAWYACTWLLPGVASLRLMCVRVTERPSIARKLARSREHGMNQAFGARFAALKPQSEPESAWSGHGQARERNPLPHLSVPPKLY